MLIDSGPSTDRPCYKRNQSAVVKCRIRSRADLVVRNGWLGGAPALIPVGVRAGGTTTLARSLRRLQLVENDPDCVRCRHPKSQHEVEDNADEDGDSEDELRGACEVRTCCCPRFSSPHRACENDVSDARGSVDQAVLTDLPASSTSSRGGGSRPCIFSAACE